jgi:hypothetical protein
VLSCDIHRVLLRLNAAPHRYFLLWTCMLSQVASWATHSCPASCSQGLWVCPAGSQGDVTTDGVAAIGALSCATVPGWCWSGRSGWHGWTPQRGLLTGGKLWIYVPSTAAAITCDMSPHMSYTSVPSTATAITMCDMPLPCVPVCRVRGWHYHSLSANQVWSILTLVCWRCGCESPDIHLGSRSDYLHHNWW